MPSKFEIVGFVAYEVKGNAIGLKVKVLDGKYENTLEVLCFKGEHKGLKAGEEVHITGNLSTKKSEHVRIYNGKEYPVWLTQLVAREVTVAQSRQTTIAPGKPTTVKPSSPGDDSEVPF